MIVLILGGNGMLGHKLCEVLAPRFDVWTTFQNSPNMYEFLPPSRQITGISAENTTRIGELLDMLKPNVVINTVGLVKQRAECSQAEPTIMINSLFPHQLAALCTERGIRSLHFSTDCVFSGYRGNYTEEDIPDPTDLYGRSKLLGEVISSDSLTIRTSFIGWQLNSFTSLLSWFARQRGSRIQGYAKAIYSGVTTAVLASLIAELLQTIPSLSGLYQVSGNPISKYNLLSLLRDRLGWADIEIERNDNFTCDRSLSGTKFHEATGWAVPSWEVMIEGLAGEWSKYQKYYLQR